MFDKNSQLNGISQMGFEQCRDSLLLIILMIGPYKRIIINATNYNEKWLINFIWILLEKIQTSVSYFCIGEIQINAKICIHRYFTNPTKSSHGQKDVIKFYFPFGK